MSIFLLFIQFYCVITSSPTYQQFKVNAFSPPQIPLVNLKGHVHKSLTTVFATSITALLSFQHFIAPRCYKALQSCCHPRWRLKSHECSICSDTQTDQPYGTINKSLIGTHSESLIVIFLVFLLAAVFFFFLHKHQAFICFSIHL